MEQSGRTWLLLAADVLQIPQGNTFPPPPHPPAVEAAAFPIPPGFIWAENYDQGQFEMVSNLAPGLSPEWQLFQRHFLRLNGPL